MPGTRAFARMRPSLGRHATRNFRIPSPRSTPAAGWARASRADVCCASPRAADVKAHSTLRPVQVTVVDISPEMLVLDRQVAAERGLEVRTVEASMDELSMFAPASFEIVIQPVSTCYVPSVAEVYRQVARIVAPGGLYVSQHKQPTSLQTAIEPSPRGYEITEPYYRVGPLPPVAGSPHREPGTLEFLHRWEELLGGLCRAGFTIEDVIEPLLADEQADAGSFVHRSRYVPPYIRIKARRTTAATDGTANSKMWIPQ